MDRLILQKAQDELDAERRKRDAFKQKIQNAKEERDRQLKEAQEKKKLLFAKQRKDEITEVQ